MTLLWQHIIVIAALASAGLYLVRHFRKSGRVKPGCKSCEALRTLTEKQPKP
jgi:hypothetical protein